MALSSPEACKLYVTVENSAQIARKLRQDQQLCRDGKLPTVLAHFVPDTGSAQADDIAAHILPQTEVRIPISVRRMQYAGIVDGIKAYLAQMKHLDDKERNLINIPVNETTEPPNAPIVEDEGVQKKILSENFDAVELDKTMRILVGLHTNGILKETDVLPNILDALRVLAAPGKSGRIAPLPSVDLRKRRCYICRFIIKDKHELYPSLCTSCGDFNLAEGGLSLPDNLELKGRIALVTGGRINLGYHTALRLLRCGAKVIVSTRYPQDAELRYRAEKYSESWIDRLCIVGADFRTAKDVFRLIGTMKKILDKWKAEDETTGRLFLLVNNAAQTLTDPIAAEKKAIANESRLRQLNIEDTSAVITNGYEAAVRGGSLMPGGLLEAGGMKETVEDQPYESYSSQKTEPQEELEHTDRNSDSIINFQQNALTTMTTKSSWVQSLHEIPYEDIITAHSVNTFVPLILIRELLQLMISSPNDQSLTLNGPSVPPRPIAHIINVSSREGMFEDTPNSREKAGLHVHTNMTKAGLNMITETEAASFWTKHRIAMNTVDPGYMSAAPEIRVKKDREHQQTPIGFEDGAARVLWPVAVAEGKKDKRLGPIWGRFLKHFGAKEVDVSLGR